MLHALDALHGESPSGFSDELTDSLDFVIHHLRGETRIGSQKDRLVHDFIGPDHFTQYPERLGPVFAELDEDRLPKEIAPEEHAVADFLGIEMTRQIGVGEGSRRLHPEHKAEPGTSGCTTG